MSEPQRGQWTPADVAAVTINPYLAIGGDVDEETWIKLNLDTMKELGPEAYLRNLVALLREADSGEAL